MKRLLPHAALAAALLASGCASTENAAMPAAVVPVAAAPGTASPPAVKPAPVANPGSSVTTAAAPSFKETARLDRELGDQVIPYPFNHCAVIQRPFGSEEPKHRRIYNGYEVLFCCTPCVRAFDANPEPYMPRIIAAAKEKAAGTVTPPVVAGAGS
jgi:YHS domain-containing protein